MRKGYFLIVFLFICSCASPRAAYKKGFDFSGIRDIRVGNFSSFGGNSNSGPVVAGEFIRQLINSGYSVKQSPSDNVDAVIEGNVTEYYPNRRFLIQVAQKEGTGNNVVIYQSPVEISGSNVYNLGSAFGLGEENRVVVSNATIGISAMLKDARTGEVVWSNMYTYEGLDLGTALEGTVKYLLRSLPYKGDSVNSEK